MFKKLNKKGFSLIELIVVVAIMAILVALLAPNVLKYIEKSKFGKDINSLDTVRLGIEAELMDEKLSGYSTDGWITLASIYDAYEALGDDGLKDDSSDEARLGSKLFGTAQVLSVDFQEGKPFTSKTAAAAEVYVYVDGNGGIAVAGVAENAIVSYNDEDLVVSSKLNTIPAISSGDDE